MVENCPEGNCPERNCPDCNGKLRHLLDEVYCTICGLVIESEMVDFGIDWKGNEMDAHGIDSARAGKPGTFVDGDKYSTSMSEIMIEDCIRCDKKRDKK